MPDSRRNLPLVRTLAQMTQLHLPGTAGRLAQQARDLERVAPVFAGAGLVRKVVRPEALTVHAGGIATEAPTPFRIMGGFLYAAGAVRLDLVVRDNQVAAGTQNSACEVDDIDFEDQRIRLQLTSIRQAYELADVAMQDGEPRDLLILDCPLLISRSMAAPRAAPVSAGHQQAYESARAAVAGFWERHRERVFPWDESGPMVVGVGSGRYGTVLQLAQQDLRTSEGRSLILPDEPVDAAELGRLVDLEQAILSIGERRFLHGVVGPFTRTAAFHLSLQSPRMEPAAVADLGVVGFHFKGAQGSSVRFAHMVGPAAAWGAAAVDGLAAWLMSLCAIGGPRAEPLPVMLARRELRPLEGFLKSYALEVREQMRSRRLEEVWLGDLDELD